MNENLNLNDNKDNALCFYCGNLEVLRFVTNGDVYVNGKLTVNDTEITEGLREFIKYQNNKIKD